MTFNIVPLRRVVVSNGIITIANTPLWLLLLEFVTKQSHSGSFSSSQSRPHPFLFAAAALVHIALLSGPQDGRCLTGPPASDTYPVLLPK